MENSEKPAFANNQSSSLQGDDGIGLTKREYFAAKAMQALISNPNIKRPSIEAWEKDLQDFSRTAIEYADALLKELNKPQQ